MFVDIHNFEKSFKKSQLLFFFSQICWKSWLKKRLLFRLSVTEDIILSFSPFLLKYFEIFFRFLLFTVIFQKSPWFLCLDFFNEKPIL